MTRPLWRIVGVGFDHGHIAEQLGIALGRADAEVVGVQHHDVTRMTVIADSLGIPMAARFSTMDEVLETQPDIAIVCTSTVDHAATVEALAERGVDVLIEKPFGSSVSDAERMIRARDSFGIRMVINWPLAYYQVHRTTRRLVSEGLIGDIREIHYYDGNRGPFDRLNPAGEPDPADAWWFDPERGGGSIQDYLGYGVTLASWFLEGESPERVSAMSHVPPGSLVDTHAVVTAEYPWGLATFQTRWGMLSDPWLRQTAPRTGFVVVGSRAALVSEDYASSVRLHDSEHPDGIEIPVDRPEVAPTALGELICARERGIAVTGPASPELSLLGQRIVDAAVKSASEGRTITWGEA
jgi:predicted dehydrogenase